jgi:NADH-quinone oxidoreductase subunit J
MSLFFAFFCLFSSLALVSAILVIASKNPVYSVLFLILSFCNVSALLFLLNLEFLPITFLVVYVGAIAVLFLFVLMMLNIKLTELKAENAHFLPVACLLGIVFVLELFVMIRLEFLPLTFSFVHSPFLSDFANSSASFIDFPLFYLNESNMRSLGQILFVEY